MNAGVIVAGGKGSRFGGYKQTTILNNKPINVDCPVGGGLTIISINECVAARELWSPWGCHYC